MGVSGVDRISGYHNEWNVKGVTQGSRGECSEMVKLRCRWSEGGEC